MFVGEILREGREFNVSVNITAEQMNNPKFVEKVIRYAKNDQVEGHFGLRSQRNPLWIR